MENYETSNHHSYGKWRDEKVIIDNLINTNKQALVKSYHFRYLSGVANLLDA